MNSALWPRSGAQCWSGAARRASCAWPGLEGNPSHGANLHVDEVIACGGPRACDHEPRPRRGQRSRAAVADPSGCRSRWGTDAEGAVGLGIRPLPRLAPGVCGAMGLAYAGLLPLPGAAWLLTEAKSGRTSRDAAHARLLRRKVRGPIDRGRSRRLFGKPQFLFRRILK